MTFTLHKQSGMWIRPEYSSQDVDVVNEVILSDGYFTCLRGHRGEGEIVVDIGAHIGSFAKLWHTKNPLAKIVCVEACPDNIEVLTKNVGEFASVIHAACSYEPGELALLNSVKENGTATGGSVVVPSANIETPCQHFHWKDTRSLGKITLETIMSTFDAERIDVLKLDCEGSEFSILENSPSLDRIGIMFGEYHGQARWDAMRANRLKGWDYGHMHAGGDLGIFHYVNPAGAP